MTNLFVDAQDKIDRCLNSFATESFRDQADRDYIHARLACRSELFPQFLWSSHQALEKYLKAILLYNRIEATRVRHDILGALALTRHLPFKIELSNRSKRFLDHVADLGEHRYLDVPYYVHGHVMVDLDLCVWELRRYCQVLNVFGKALPSIEESLLQKAKTDLELSRSQPRHLFRLHGGHLEKILDNPRHPSRPPLVWNNPCYGVRARKVIRARAQMHAQNPLLLHYPEILPELQKYVFIPGSIAAGYRALANEAAKNTTS